MDGERSIARGLANTSQIASPEMLKAALSLGGRRTLDSIQPGFIQVLRNAPYVKGETADIMHHIMEKYEVTLEEVCCLLILLSLLDKKRLVQLEDLLSSRQEQLQEAEGCLLLARNDADLAKNKLEQLQGQLNVSALSEESQELPIAGKMLHQAPESTQGESTSVAHTDEDRTLQVLREEMDKIYQQLRETQETANLNFIEKEKYRRRAKEMTVRVNRMEDIIHHLQKSDKSLHDQQAPRQQPLLGNSKGDHVIFEQHGQRLLHSPHSSSGIQVDVVAREPGRCHSKPRREDLVVVTFHSTPPTSVDDTTDLGVFENNSTEGDVPGEQCDNC